MEEAQLGAVLVKKNAQTHEQFACRRLDHSLRSAPCAETGHGVLRSEGQHRVAIDCGQDVVGAATVVVSASRAARAVVVRLVVVVVGGVLVARMLSRRHVLEGVGQTQRIARQRLVDVFLHRRRHHPRQAVLLGTHRAVLQFAVVVLEVTARQLRPTRLALRCKEIRRTGDALRGHLG